MNAPTADKILRAVETLTGTRDSFTETELIEQLGISALVWEQDYAPVLRGMLTERPADAPDSGAKNRELFDQTAEGEYRITEYGKSLLDQTFKHSARASDTIELPRVEPAPDEPMDGLRAWQSAVVRLWSNSTDTFAELSIGWLPPESADAPWIAGLYCGDRSEDGWIEDVQVIKAGSAQQALQRLWDRAKARHGLFKDDPRLPIKAPTDYPTDLWISVAERALIDRAVLALRRKAPKTGMRLIYHPDRRPGERWAAVLHPFNVEPPEGTLHEAVGGTLAQALNSLFHEIDTRFKTGELEQQIDPDLLELMERKTDVGIPRPRLSGRKTLTDGEQQAIPPTTDTDNIDNAANNPD
jgi:hypothetical protein